MRSMWAATSSVSAIAGKVVMYTRSEKLMPGYTVANDGNHSRLTTNRMISR